jgi:large subunit ribosomal protein L17
MAYMQDRAVTHRLFEELKDRYLDRQGGYVRIVKKGYRKGDGAPVSIVQLLPAEEGKKAKKKAKKTTTAKAVSGKPKKEATKESESSAVEKPIAKKDGGKPKEKAGVKKKPKEKEEA